MPSPTTICERSVTSAAKCRKSTITRPGSSVASLPQKVIVSPARTVRSTVSADSRSLGPCRSKSRPERTPRTLGRGAHRGGAAAQVVMRPWEQFRRAESTPAPMRPSSTPGVSVAGPSVETIFVRRANIRSGVSQPGDVHGCRAETLTRRMPRRTSSSSALGTDRP